MILYRYAALGAEGTLRRGELASATEAEARASLRRVGLQVVDISVLRPPEHSWELARGISRVIGVRPIAADLKDAWQHNLRSRRRIARADLFDSLSTLLRAGVPLVEAVSTVANSKSSAPGRSGARRAMLLELREKVRSGTSLAEAFRAHSDWFDAADAAIVEAALLGGTLPETLAALAERTEHTGQLGQKLVGALIYPAIVTAAGIGVAVFLGVKTLPQLAAILDGAGLEVPPLTRVVMAVGSFVVTWGIFALLAGALGAVSLILGFKRSGLSIPGPPLMRRIALGDASLRLAELLASGVPITEALRAVAPGTPRALRALLTTAAQRIERGHDLAGALDDPRWFEEEFTRVVAVGESGGDLPAMLDRLGRRLERDARRRLDRVIALAEPIVILILAIFVGLVVMAAILPLVRIKDII